MKGNNRYQSWYFYFFVEIKKYHFLPLISVAIELMLVDTSAKSSPSLSKIALFFACSENDIASIFHMVSLNVFTVFSNYSVDSWPLSFISFNLSYSSFRLSSYSFLFYYSYFLFSSNLCFDASTSFWLLSRFYFVTSNYCFVDSSYCLVPYNSN